MDVKDQQIQRLKKIVEAYEKLTAYSHLELLEANRIIDAQEKVQEFSGSEMHQLRARIKELEQDREEGLQDRIKAILNEDKFNETRILEEFERIRGESGNSFYVDLLKVLVHFDFSLEDARDHWNGILKHTREMQDKLDRPVSFRVGMLDYFISQNKILKNPMMIEISIFDEVVKSSLQDELTRLYNRRYFDMCLVREVNRARRHRSSVALLMVDIDDFKQFNDRFGHQTGDEIMRTIGVLLRTTFRNEDIPCRFGGEEFVVVLPETTSKQALTVARRFLDALKTSRVNDTVITVSGGIAHFPDHADNPANLLLEADRALYRAKQDGKDKIILA